jgi:hypothetical protein
MGVKATVLAGGKGVGVRLGVGEINGVNSPDSVEVGIEGTEVASRQELKQRASQQTIIKLRIQ